MSRKVSIWVAKNDDEAIPMRVRLRVFDKFNGYCAICTRRLQPNNWACDHITPLILGGKHIENNLQPICINPCHAQKTRQDVAIKSAIYQKRAKRLKLKKRKLIPGSKGSGFRKRMDGTVIKEN